MGSTPVSVLVASGYQSPSTLLGTASLFGIGMVAMTGKGIGSGSGEMELRKGMPLPIVLRATLKLLALNL